MTNYYTKAAINTSFINLCVDISSSFTGNTSDFNIDGVTFYKIDNIYNLTP